MDPLAPPGSKGADDMRFMALQRPTMLSFDWNAPPSLPEARAQRTFVVVRLADVDGKSTRVTLHHTGWGAGGEWDKTYAYFDRAWGYVLGNLKKRYDVGPQDWTEWMTNLRKRAQPPRPPHPGRRRRGPPALSRAVLEQEVGAVVLAEHVGQIGQHVCSCAAACRAD
jgi:hypothetical protein